MLRAARYPVRLLHSLVSGRWIRLLVELSYLTGYLYEYFIAYFISRGEDR